MSVLVVNTTTIDDVANWAAVDQLKRYDILPFARASALGFYRLLCQKVPFDSLRLTSSELPLVASTASYDLAAALTAASLPPLAGICSIRLTYGTNKFRRLRRSHARVYDSLGSIQYNIPSTYARWGGNLEFNPGPSSSSYTYRLRYWTVPEIPGNDPETHVLVTPPEWDELLNYETLYRCLIHLDEYEKAQMLVNPMPMPRQVSSKKTVMFETAIIPRLWNDLLLTIDQREGVDEDFNIGPVVRSYTRHG